MEGETRHNPPIASYARILKRRWWVVVLCALVVPVAAVLFTARQDAQYEASAEVYFNNQNMAAALTGIRDAGLFVDDARALETQANLLQTPRVARRALAASGISALSAEEVLAQTYVEPKGNSDILTVYVTDTRERRAQRLANALAHAFVADRSELDTRAIKQARAETLARLVEMEEARKTKSAAYQTLEETEQQLATFATLGTERASVIREADVGYQVAPDVTRNAALGVILGVLLGIGLALALDAMDTRVRSGAEAGARLRLPLLARLPTPPRRLSRHDELVMLAQPTGAHAEAFRMFRTNLAFTQLDTSVRTILVTSAVEKEGKSTTVANLAVALARAGKRVALVDLDLRQPYLERFFGLPTTPGITDVALGMTPLGEALRRIDLSTGLPATPSEPGSSSNGSGELGSVDVLVSGPIPPDPGEFVATQRLAGILESLRSHFDIVLIDSPPLLRVGDALTLSNGSDGVIVVSRLRVVRRPMLDEVRRLLHTSPAPGLGFVITGADGGKKSDGYGYGYRYGAWAPRTTTSREEPQRTAGGTA